MPLQLKLEGPVPPRGLPEDLTDEDTGRVWWDDLIWFVWMGDRWRKAIATRTKPGDRS